MEKINNCFCCRASDFKLYANAKDNYADETFNIVQCKNCGFVFTNPRPSMENIGKYYNATGYLSHQSHSRGFIQSIYRLARNYMKRRKLVLIQSLIGKKDGFKLLDFGCGTGDFLYYVQQNNICAEGIEPDEKARRVAKDINKIDVYTLEDMPNIEFGKYDVITLWHVLEHIHNLHEQINYLHKWLNSNGKLVIAVPNINSYDAQKYKEYWEGLDVPRHIYHFSQKNIKQIVEQHQFKFRETQPLFLDAYYVSMRSEWHLGTNKFLAYFKAIITGFISNNKAKQSGDYSSLIYIFDKK
jgi:2-polyprenyl-3-methyl-5-hydroxy-6-metoxy-1,4-benzoquinol methylase